MTQKSYFLSNHQNTDKQIGFDHALNCLTDRIWKSHAGCISFTCLKHFTKICYHLIIQSVRKGDLDEVSSALEEKTILHVQVKSVHTIFQVDRVQMQTRALRKISSPLSVSLSRKLAKKIQYQQFYKL